MKGENFLQSLGKNKLLGKIASVGAISLGAFTTVCAFFLFAIPSSKNVVALVYLFVVILLFFISMMIFHVRDSK